MRFGQKFAIGFGLVVLTASFGLAQQAVPDSTVKPAAEVSTAPAAASADAPKLEVREQRYHIAAGDTFDVTFELSPEFNQTAVAVQPDGFVTLKGVGDLQVQGQTVPQLTETLRHAYSEILNDPILSVVLRDFEKPYFIADGQVSKPGKYDLRGTVTLTQAIAIAGGFNDKSKHSQVLLFRRVNSQWMHAEIIDVKKMEKSGKLKEDIALRPGDMLFVPKNTLSKIDPFFPTASMGTFFKP